MATAVLLTSPATPAAAASALLQLEAGMQSCLNGSSPQACRAFGAQVQALQSNPAYGRSSHLCKEQIGELNDVVKLLPKRDVVPTDVMASVADVQQACIPYGF